MNDVNHQFVQISNQMWMIINPKKKIKKKSCVTEFFIKKSS